MEKSIVLIDAENVIRSWRAYCEEHGLDEKIDYKRLIDHLTKDTNFLRAYFYDGIQEASSAGKNRFHRSLQHIGIQIRTKILKKRTKRCSKCGNVDSMQIQKGV